MPQIDVKLPTGSYSITIEPGLLSRVGELVREVVPHDRAMLAVDQKIADSHGVVVERSLRTAGFGEVGIAHLVSDESHKTADGLRKLYDAMLGGNLERRSPVIALGGGVVGDMAGFAAATYLRGVPVVQVPTTLLAMVDAAIGGKTGVNVALPNGDLVKNIVGAFWQPKAVLIDPLVLRTLDERDYRCGLAECVKHGMISNGELIDFIANNTDRISALGMDVLTDLITRSAQIKVAIVQVDERESGRRALLNLGHTFAHAIEPIEQLHLRHGEAVSIGLMAACKCSVETGRMTTAEAKQVGSLLLHCKLPVWLPKPVSAARLRSAMAHDKKIIDGRLRLILPVGLGRAEIVDDVPEEVIDAALHEIGAVL